MAIDYTKRPSNPAGAGAADAAGGKVQLTKASPSVSLTKSGATTGSVRLNLSWTSGAPKKGFFKKSGGIDLDLGCLYEFADGSKGVVQALGNAFTAGPGKGRPIITLDGDDRSGSNSAGENLHVDLSRADDIRRILFFAFIYEGAPNWAAADGVVTVYPQSGPEIETRLDATSEQSRMCAIALLERRGGNELVLNRENRYIDGGQRKLDEAYGWGLRWTTGSK